MNTGFIDAMTNTFARITTELKPALKERFSGQIKVEKLNSRKATIELGAKVYQLRYEPENSNINFVLYRYERNIHAEEKFVFDSFISANTPAIVTYLLK